MNIGDGGLAYRSVNDGDVDTLKVRYTKHANITSPDRLLSELLEGSLGIKPDSRG